MAFPFLTGFYSKDLLLNIAVILIPRNATATIAYLLTVVAAFLTAIYSVRLIILCFITPPSHLGYVGYTQTVFMTLPLVMLSFLAVVFGYLTSELFLGIQSYQGYQGALFSHPDH
jgi:NADH-ubiquinone oxidoreductase chain 5